MPDRNHFDRSKPFYPLIMNYLATLHGFKTMMLEGALVGNPDAIPCDIARYFRKPEALGGDVKKGIVKLVGALELACRCGEPPVEVGYDFIAKEYGDNRDYILESFPKHAVFGLITLAWEDTMAYHDAGPLWEFLHHARNASAHNGRWHFKHGEPKNLAEWKTFRLDPSLHAKPLLHTPKEPGMLSFGDPVNLLWDIEQAYPNLKI